MTRTDVWHTHCSLQVVFIMAQRVQHRHRDRDEINVSEKASQRWGAVSVTDARTFVEPQLELVLALLVRPGLRVLRSPSRHRRQPNGHKARRLQRRLLGLS